MTVKSSVASVPSSKLRTWSRMASQIAVALPALRASSASSRALPNKVLCAILGFGHAIGDEQQRLTGASVSDSDG